MKTSRIIKTLSIVGLFGQYDISIQFSNLTVIVGKNGLGKTTLLKILKGFITGKHELFYSEICESIELVFDDGNIISFGDISDEMSRAVARKGIFNHIMHDEKGIESIFKGIDGINEKLSEEEKKDLAERLIESAFKSSYFIDFYKKGVNEVLEKNNKQVFSNKYHTQEVKDSVVVRYLSTVNISANAGNTIDFGNSIEKNLLDLAIYDELRLLLKNEDYKAIDAFREQINIFLRESEKECELDQKEFVFITDNQVVLPLSKLSSGERQLIYILATAANTCGKKTLFLMDEPEVSLHLSWQEKIVDAIMNINPNMQIVAVTHSPGIIMNGHMDAYIEMKDIMRPTKNV
ncbi:ATP-binding protein [Enterobacter asburiae]|uniref:AAA family ATPase n=1 Tax=Enterobacter asburiae TaxID=61645 RepID=UPI0030158D8A